MSHARWPATLPPPRVYSLLTAHISMRPGIVAGPRATTTTGSERPRAVPWPATRSVPSDADDPPERGDPSDDADAPEREPAPARALEACAVFDDLVVWAHDDVPPPDDPFVR